MNFTFMAHYHYWKAFSSTINHQSFTSPWYHALNHWLQSLCCVPRANGTWTHSNLSPRPTPQQEHLLRESWRQHLHHQYLSSSRRETHTLRHWPYHEQHSHLHPSSQCGAGRSRSPPRTTRNAATARWATAPSATPPKFPIGTIAIGGVPVSFPDPPPHTQLLHSG